MILEFPPFSSKKRKSDAELCRRLIDAAEFSLIATSRHYVNIFSLGREPYLACKLALCLVALVVFSVMSVGSAK